MNLKILLLNHKDKSVYGKRIIGNKYVIETLPSRGEKNNFNIKRISGMISNNNASDKLSSKALGKVSRNGNL